MNQKFTYIFLMEGFAFHFRTKLIFDYSKIIKYKELANRGDIAWVYEFVTIANVLIAVMVCGNLTCFGNCSTKINSQYDI